MIGDRGEEVRVLVMTIPKEDGAAAVGRIGQGCGKGVGFSSWGFRIYGVRCT